jgi:hypothetical protein
MGFNGVTIAGLDIVDELFKTMIYYSGLPFLGQKCRSISQSQVDVYLKANDGLTPIWSA